MDPSSPLAAPEAGPVRARWAGAALPYLTAIAGATVVVLVWFAVAVAGSGPEPVFADPAPTQIPADSVPAAEQTLMLHPGTRAAWPKLGVPWQEWSRDWTRREFHNPVGQAIVLDDRWINPFVGGLLNEEYVSYGGPDDLRDAVGRLGDALRDTYYRDANGNPYKGLSTGDARFLEAEFDGHRGIVMERDISWDKEIAGETSEHQTVALVDLDGDRAVGFEITISASQMDQFLPAMRSLLGLRFLD